MTSGGPSTTPFVVLNNRGAPNRPLAAAGPVTAWSTRSRAVHPFETGLGTHVLVVNGSRIYALTDDLANSLERAIEAEQVGAFLALNGLDEPPYIVSQTPASVPLRSLSLAVAQKCNLGCTYCYAEEGSFGGAAKNMPLDVALASVDRLFEEAASGERVHLTFLGGEPLVNRPVLRAATKAAAQRASEAGVKIGFSITTNGTLVMPEDGEFFEDYGFAVTISLDGVGQTHDRLRPFKGGRGSYDRIVERIAPLLKMQRRMQVSARVTVTPRNLRLRETLDELIGMGFHSAGFSPMLSSPTGRDQMDPADLEVMLEQMIECGRQFERQVALGQRYPFSNMTTAMREIHKGTHRPYPCGAGGGYFGVSADGDLFACHRFVGDGEGAMGGLASGVDREKQSAWLMQRHVDFQEPCGSCWARYLCGGGCHHEVIRRGRPACDYIRGWLHYCLQAYVRVLQSRPDYFGMP